MALFISTGNDLVKQIYRILHPGNEMSGTCTGGGASAFNDTTRTEPDDYFQNTTPPSRVRILTTTDGEAPQGQERTISDWAVSTGAGTTSAAWATANPAAGDTYIIMSDYFWSEIFNTINAVFDLTKKQTVLEKLDNSVVLVDSVYEYAVPYGFTHIYRISMADDSGNFPQVIPPDQYRIIRGAETPRIHFLRYDTEYAPQDMYYTGFWADNLLSAAHGLRIEGYGWQEKLVDGLSSCNLDPMWVAYQTAALLHARRITRSDTDPDEHRTQFQVCQQIADSIKPRMITRFPPNTKRVY